MTLPFIAVADMPRIVYSHGPEHDPALTEPEKFRPVINSPVWCKPEAGGLWTSPVTREGADGEILRTAWTDWCHAEGYRTNKYSQYQLIVPDRDARILLISSLTDLKSILAEYGIEVEDRFSLLTPIVPNWEAMAKDGIDAVFLTDEGQWETRNPPEGEPSLYGWDCASVLWLTPNYRVVS